MTDAADSNPGTTVLETKFTAAQIEENCPIVLQDLGKRIAVHSEKAQKCKDKADQHYTTVAQLLATAHGACEEGGFHAFRERFFPALGKSRVYELLAIGTNKKSDKEIKASTRARVAKHRANKAAASPSVTVTENSGPNAQGTPEDPGEIKAPSIASEQTPAPSKTWGAVASGDGAMNAFMVHVMELDRRTNKRPPEHFSATAVPFEVLTRLGKLLTAVADLKMSGVVIPVRDGDGTGPATQRAGDVDRVA